MSDNEGTQRPVNAGRVRAVLVSRALREANHLLKAQNAMIGSTPPTPPVLRAREAYSAACARLVRWDKGKERDGDLDPSATTAREMRHNRETREA